MNAIPERTCRHFGVCGGCRLQEIPYAKQIAIKKKKIEEAVLEHGFYNVNIKPFNIFSEWFYRNKMEFTFSEDNGLVLGLHTRSNKRRVFNVEECLIFSPDVSFLLENIRRFCRDKRYTAYNKFTHKGFLRHLIVREAKFTSDIMVGIVTTSASKLDEEGFLREILKGPFKERVKSVYWIINDSLGDAVLFQEKRLIYKNHFITEKIDGYSFNIDIDTFFQINSKGIGALYKKIRDYAFSHQAGKALDLYCGIGCVGIFLSSVVNLIYGVELNFSSIRAAKRNAFQNNINNIFFVCADVRKFLAGNSLRGNIDLAVVNPPRCGLSRKIKERIINIKAPYLFYSSCNPKTLLIDLCDLSSYYKPLFLEPFDFFPHTHHFEVFALLERKK